MPGVVDFVIKPGVPVADWEPGKAPGIYRDDPWDWVIALPDDAPEPVGPYLSQIRAARVSSAADPGEPLATVEITLDGQNIVGHLDQSVTAGLPAAWVWDIQDEGTGYTLLGGKGKTFDDVARES